MPLLWATGEQGGPRRLAESYFSRVVFPELVRCVELPFVSQQSTEGTGRVPAAAPEGVYPLPGFSASG